MTPVRTISADPRPRRKLIALLGAAMLAGMALMVYLIESGYREAIRSAEITSRNYAAIIEARLDATLRRADAQLLELAHGLPVAALSKQAVPRYARVLDANLDSHLINFPELAGMRVFDAGGDLIYTSDSKTISRTNVVDRDYFRRLRDDPQAGLVFAEVNIARTTGRPTLVVARALRDGQDIFRGIVIASVELDYFQKLFQSLDLGAQGIVVIRRSDDFTQVVRWPPLDRETNQPLAPGLPIRQAISAGKKEATTGFTTSVDGVTRILSFRKLDSYPFFAVTAIGRDDMLAGWRARSLAVGVAGLLLLAALAALLMRLWRVEGEQARTMAALAQSEERARLVLDTSMDAAIGMNSDGRVTEWSHGAKLMFGYTGSEALGRVLSDLIIPPALRDGHTRGLKRFLETGVGPALGRRTETTAMRADGSEFPIELSLAHIERDGEYFFSGFVRDVTARVQAEDQRQALEARLRQSQKMEALGTLSGGIAHDFNNILSAIIGNVELARQDVGPRHAALESLTEIGKASARAKDLVQQILAFSRRQAQQRHAVALPPVIEEAVKLMRATLPAGIHLATAFGADASRLKVLADPTQIHQVVMNLCSNAAHAMEGKPGRIDIGLQPIELKAADSLDARKAWPAGLQPGRYVHLSVRDTGCGMDAGTLERIFDPFYTTKRVGEGTGLGLSVVHGIMQAHEGAISVDSRPGKGSTFHLYFPALELAAEGAEAERQASAVPAGRGERVLYVDDDAALVSMVTRMLKRQGYRVSGHTWAREALEALRADPQQFDLVVTDYNMPGLSGLDMVREVRAIRADLPVALTSGYITDELRQQAAGFGVHHLIYKPNTVSELCEVVRALTSATGR